MSDAAIEYDNETLPEKPCVYLLRADSGLWKIGRSKDVAGRFQMLRSAAWRHAGVDIELFHVIRCGDSQASVDLERELHAEFAEKRRVKHGRTEWFELSADDVLRITAIKTFRAGDDAWGPSFGHLLAGAVSKAGRAASRALTLLTLAILACLVAWVASLFA
jgi:hypothetical protein